MISETVTLPDGGRAIVCSGGKRQRCACGAPATLLCDWRLGRKHGSCSTPICSRCTTSPAPNKDLCPVHAEAFEQWQAARSAQ